MSQLKVGDVFESIALAFGYVKHQDCHCCSTQKNMNEWGPAGCRKEIDFLSQEIYGTSINYYAITIPRPLIKQAILQACTIVESPSSPQGVAYRAAKTIKDQLKATT